MLVLSTPGIDFSAHQTDLIVHYANFSFGPVFAVFVIIVASLTLLMAINTAFVAGSELIERVSHRYNFNWIIKPNRLASLYRVHIGSAIFFSLVVIFTQGKQHSLAHMYAIGLLASFMIQLMSLLIYRYAKGTKEVLSYNVSRTGTFFLFIFITSSFIYLSYHRPEGFFLWFATTIAFLLIGIYGTKRRAPELREVKRGETPMDLIFYIAESDEKNVHIHFKRPFDTPQEKTYDRAVFITFYSPRQPIPDRSGESHFRIPFKRANIHHNTLAILELLQYELPDKNITVHFGWPTSSWFDRISIGVMVFQLLHLPKMFPKINFKIENFKMH